MVVFTLYLLWCSGRWGFIVWIPSFVDLNYNCEYIDRCPLSTWSSDDLTEIKNFSNDCLNYYISSCAINLPWINFSLIIQEDIWVLIITNQDRHSRWLPILSMSFQKKLVNMNTIVNVASVSHKKSIVYFSFGKLILEM